MKAIIDTNIILDAIASRTPFDVSAKEIIFMIAAKKIEAAITASTANDIYYITRKYLQSEIKTIQEMKKLFSLVDIVNVEKSDCLAAFDTASSLQFTQKILLNDLIGK
ncbi:hypothetical protein AGMMS49938_18220 [Fibrobacterales bacterium]|nr:hypothetical protein AGMMS49938_18220 [Fibrobacterales bacterium]